MTKAIYICARAPALVFRVFDEPILDIHFRDTQFTTDDPKIIAAMDQFIETKPNVSALIRKLDMNAAAQAVALHRAEHERMNQTASIVTGGALQVQKMATVGADARATLLAAGVKPEMIDAVISKFQTDHGLNLTVHTGVGGDAQHDPSVGKAQEPGPVINPVTGQPDPNAGTGQQSSDFGLGGGATGGTMAPNVARDAGQGAVKSQKPFVFSGRKV